MTPGAAWTTVFDTVCAPGPRTLASGSRGALVTHADFRVLTRPSDSQSCKSLREAQGLWARGLDTVPGRPAAAKIFHAGSSGPALGQARSWPRGMHNRKVTCKM